MSSFTIKKTTPNKVLFLLHSLSNPNQVKRVVLTKKQPQVALPDDWALDIFFNSANFNLYKKGLITFDDNEAAVRAAAERGVYYDDKLSFTPAKDTDLDEIKTALFSGNRTKIEDAIERFGKDRVLEVATANADELTSAVTRVIEGIFKVQLTLNQE